MTLCSALFHSIHSITIVRVKERSWNYSEIGRSNISKMLSFITSSGSSYFCLLTFADGHIIRVCACSFFRVEKGERLLNVPKCSSLEKYIKRESDKNQLKSWADGNGVIPKGERERRRRRRRRTSERERRRKYCCVVKIDGIRQRINDLNYNAFCDSKLSNFREDNLIAVIAGPLHLPSITLTHCSFDVLPFPPLSSSSSSSSSFHTSLFFTLNRHENWSSPRNFMTQFQFLLHLSHSAFYYP